MQPRNFLLFLAGLVVACSPALAHTVPSHGSTASFRPVFFSSTLAPRPSTPLTLTAFNTYNTRSGQLFASPSPKCVVPPPVPEPSTLVLLGTGLLVLAWGFIRRPRSSMSERKNGH